jgi:hypothetical protein
MVQRKPVQQVSSPATTSLSILININLENGMKTQSENAILWIEKLLTAKADGVKQGRGNLGNFEDGFCCLGYGCEINKIDYADEDGSSHFFMKTVGLLDIQGSTAKYNRDFRLVDLNDRQRWGFTRIARRLQKYPHQYFITEVAKSIKEHFA